MSQESEGSKSLTTILKTNTTGALVPDETAKVLHSQDRVDALEKAAGALEGELQKVRAERCTERFFWSFSTIALTNVIVSSFAPGIAATVFLIFSLMLALGLARWLEVPFIAPYIERWLEKLMGRVPKPDETE